MRVLVRLNCLLLCTVLAAGTAQAQKSSLQSGASPTSLDSARKRLIGFLREPLPGRAVAEEPPSLYKPADLYQYIDGGADVYLLYDFQLLLHEDFKSGKAELTADIYDMGKTEDAFGIYAAERSPSYKFVSIGVEGYRSEGTLNFLQDHYYVKLSGSGAGAAPLLDQLAQTLSARIGGAKTLPPLLAKLPRDHRVQHSEKYMRKDPLGHAFLAPAYVVAYASGKQESKLLISVSNDAREARTRLDLLAKHFKDTGESAAAAELGQGGIRAKNSFEGRVIARTQGRYLIALLNPPENGAEILKTVASSLP